MNTFQDIELTHKVVRNFVDTSFDKYKSFAHCAGYTEVLLTRALMELPTKKRKSFLDQLTRETIKMNEEINNA